MDSDCLDGPAIRPYVGGLAYSAELVSLGSPCGAACPDELIPSSPMADVYPDASANRPGQPIVPVQAGSGTDFRLGLCAVSGVIANKTPYLIYQYNGVSPIIINGCQFLVDPTPGSGAATVVPTNPFVTLPIYLDFNATTITNPTPPVSPIPSQTQHYYYCQWVLMCGATTPFDPWNTPFIASNPFRVAVSNPN